MAFCLPDFAAKELLKRLQSGEITPERIADLPSAERRKSFEFLGEEQAKRVNALFESKLLLKNQQQGFKTWAKQVLGVNHPLYRDALAKVERLGEKVLSPDEQTKFLEDLVEMRLGAEVTPTEAAKLLDLSKKVEETKASLPKKTQEYVQKPGATREYLKNETPEELAGRLEYGWAMVNFKKYAESLHPDSAPIGLKDFIEHPVLETLNLAKTLKATWDNSFWGNQGITTLLNPRNADLWVKGLIRSFNDIQKTLRGGSAADAVRAEVYSRPDAINGTYAREQLALGLRREEALPSSLPERVPVMRLLFQASSEAYTAAAIRLRADLADRINAIARKQGRDLTDRDLAKQIGGMINDTTGRGSLGAAEGTLRSINAIAFSPRLLAGTWRVLTTPLKFGSKDPFVRRQATRNLASMAATWYGLMQIIEALHPGSTDTDPRSAHFGQVRIGEDTWVNTMGGFRPIIRATAQLWPTTHEGELGFWRRSRTGKWQHQQLFGKKPDFGAYTPLDAAEDFFEAKASPGLAALINIWRGSTFSGEKNTPETFLRSLTVPITLDQVITNVQDDAKTEDAIRDAILNGLGFGVTTYK